jgi:FMN phosphatase YigB (HAD superfamily)
MEDCGRLERDHCSAATPAQKTGLSDHLDAWVIWESAGVTNSDPWIFQMAVEAAALLLDGARMIGACAEADIGGAHRLELRGICLSRSRNWPIR